MTRAHEQELAELDVDGRRVAVRVRRSKRARHAWVRVESHALVEIVLPRSMPRRYAAQILAEKEGWIRRQLERQKESERRAPELGLDRAGVVWLHHEPVPIEVLETDAAASGSWRARLRRGHLQVRGPRGGSWPNAGAEHAVQRWYRNEARRRIGGAVEREAATLGVSPGRLAIRDPRTRWASCSSRGTLSFSWRLLLAPFEVLDYVVIHELCHLRELNHSPAFWEHVEQARPGYREQVAWLREYERELHAYQPTLSHGAARPA